MKKIMQGFLAVAITALMASPAVANVLVQDSFDADGYTVGQGLKDYNPGNSTGFTAKKWGNSNSSGVFFVNDGLALPDDFIFQSSGNSIGVGNFTSDPTGGKFGRRITRKIDDGLIPASGTYYVRLACSISEEAEKFLAPNHWEALGLSAIELANSDGVDVIPASGIHFAFWKTGAKGETGTKLVVTAKSAEIATLVNVVEAGATYIVVAEISIDDAGKASVRAIAGKADDPALRIASLPETPAEGTVGKDALRYLCLSGVYMSGYTKGKWASFDEFALGESLSDVFGFNTADGPIMLIPEASNIGLTGFTAATELVQVGSSAPEIFFDIGTDADGETYESTSLGTYSTTGPVSCSRSGLTPGLTYYWRFRAVGAGDPVTSPWQSITMPGSPRFGVPSVIQDGQTAAVSVSLEEPGLDGTASTTVEFWFAASDQVLALRETLGATAEAHDFSTTVESLVLGQSYDYAFRATVPYGDGVIEAWSVTNSFSVKADVVWTGADGTDWNTAENWTPQVAPISSVTTYFRTAGGSVTATADGSAADIHVNVTGDGASFDFGASSLSADSFNVGSETSHSLATLGRGNYTFGAVTVGFGSDVGGVTDGSVGSHLAVGSGAVLNAASMTIGYPLELVSASNRVSFAAGSKSTVSGILTLCASRGTRADVEPDASLSVANLKIESTGAALTVDGGAFTNSGETVVMTKKGFGRISDPIVLEFRNGASGKLGSHVFVNSGRNADNNIVHGELRVLSGSVVDASGQILYIDDSSSRGPSSDIGHGARVVVSNATMMVKSAVVCNDDRHHDVVFFVHEDEGENARLSASENFRIGCATWSRSDICNYGNRLRVEGGEVDMRGTFFIGDNGPYYAKHNDNRLEVSGKNPLISAKAMEVYGASYIEFEIPPAGYDGVPLVVTQKADFGIVPGGQTAETWTPVNEIRVDASQFVGTQVLLQAGSIAGLDASRVKVSMQGGMQATVSLTDTELAVTVQPSATVLVVR